MTSTLSDEDRAFLEGFVGWHRDRYEREWTDERTDKDVDAFLREAMEEGFTPPEERYHGEIAERAGVDDYDTAMDRLEEKGVFERVTDIVYRLPREDDEDIEDRRVEREMLVFDPDVLEALF